MKIGDYVKMRNVIIEDDLYYGTISYIKNAYVYVDITINGKTDTIEKYEYEIEIIKGIEDDN